MVFSSTIFLIYFLPIFLGVYYLTPVKYKNVVLLLFSIFFYSWGAPKFIFVILGTTFIDFYLVGWMYESKSKKIKNLFLTLSILINLGLLCYFKYSNFFIENVNLFLAQFGFHQIQWVKVILPIGISFYTFETITYVVDTYRGIHKPLKNVWDYQVYIMLFPKLIAGPIIRYHDLADQINPQERSKNDTVDSRLIGFYRFSIGLAKKVIIANQVGAQADIIFNQGDFNNLSTSTAWLGILAYTFQIYFDFSGYSDMAIGLGRMMGFRFPENFNNPYASFSITEFWRRWHISVSSWMKNYLYIPLGGNRVKSNTRLYFNLWLVFLISGLWHGADWSFVFWGAYHGLFLILERSFLLKVYAAIGKIPSTIITFVVVMIGWVFFRLEDFSKSLLYIEKMFSVSAVQDELVKNKFYTFAAIAFLFSFLTMSKVGQRIQDWFYFNAYTYRKHLVVSVMSIFMLIISLSYIASSDFNPFIYFRF